MVGKQLGQVWHPHQARWESASQLVEKHQDVLQQRLQSGFILACAQLGDGVVGLLLCSVNNCA